MTTEKEAAEGDLKQAVAPPPATPPVKIETKDLPPEPKYKVIESETKKKEEKTEKIGAANKEKMIADKKYEETVIKQQ